MTIVIRRKRSYLKHNRELKIYMQDWITTTEASAL
jgi:hypothetical protein